MGFPAYLPFMPRRSIPPRALDDAAFPVRLKLRVPPNGFGPLLIDMLRWLRHRVGDGHFAHHEAETLEEEALAFHFRCLRDAADLLSAFPMLELADSTTLPAYTRQRVPAGGETLDKRTRRIS